jgi:hypothetical protein
METFAVTYKVPGKGLIRTLIVAFNRARAMAQARIEAASLGEGTRIIKVEA